MDKYQIHAKEFQDLELEMEALHADESLSAEQFMGKHAELLERQAAWVSENAKLNREINEQLDQDGRRLSDAK